MKIREIKSAPGYGCSADGTIWRITQARINGARKQKLPYKIKGIDNRGRYYYVNIYGENGSHYTKYIHKLVAETWLGDPKGRDVHHRNGDSFDNRVKNLEYVTRRKHCCEHEATRGNPATRKLNVRDVLKILKEGMTASEVRDAYGITYSHAYCIVTGRSWKQVHELIKE